MIHCLKTWPEHFELVLAGLKTFEVRRDDRGYRVGDLLCLQEWDPADGELTGRECQRRISCITATAGPVRLLDGLVVLGLEDAKGLGSVTRELARLVGFLHDLAGDLGVPATFGTVEEAALRARAVALRVRVESLPEVLQHLQDAHGTLLLGTAPAAKEHIAQAAVKVSRLMGVA